MDHSKQLNWRSTAQNWQHRPPIVPHAEDIDWFRRCARSVPCEHSKQLLLLGVTAGIATLPFLPRDRLTAVDWSAEMIKKAWPHAQLAAASHVVQADWKVFPFRDGWFDIALGDGCYTALGAMDDIVASNASIARVLTPGGILALRCFARPEEALDLDEIFDRLLAGRYTNLGLFRWLLMMALQGDSNEGVKLDDAWQVWRERVPEAKSLIERFGWYQTEVEHIERYRGLTASYIYPTIEEMREAAAPHFFVESIDTPSYEHGELFPRLRFKRSS